MKEILIFLNTEFRFICDNPADLEELVENLHPQGVRESELKAKIQSRCVRSHYKRELL